MSIPRENNDKLCEFARRWKLDGDWLTCTKCRRSLIASRDGEPMGHQVDCKQADQLHPWAELRSLIQPAAPEGVPKHADQMTRSEKLRAAGFTRRPTGRTAGGLWPDPEPDDDGADRITPSAGG